MACFAASSLHRSGSLLARPSSKPRNVSMKAGQSITTLSASVQQHFGSEAFKEFEKTELGQLNLKDLSELSQQLKERVTSLKVPEIPADLQFPELPSDLQLPDLSGVSDAVRKFGERIDTPVELNAAFEALRSSSAASLAAATPQNGANFSPHWGSHMISGVLNDSLGSIHGSAQFLLHEIVLQITEKLSSAGAL